MILIGGGIIYAILCQPAVGKRGFPPTDPAWDAIPHLWIIPLILSSIFNRAASRIRLRWILIYSYFTACFVFGSFTFMVPRMMNPMAMLVGGLFVAPFHILVASVVELILRALRKVAHCVLAPHSRLRLIAKACLTFAVLGSAVAAPLMSRQYVVADQKAKGRRAAEADWRMKRAKVFKSITDRYEYVGNVQIRNDFDAKTGFRFEYFPKFFGCAEAYDQRIQELIEERGLPDWSMKAHLVSNAEMVRLLTTANLAPVTKSTHQLTPWVVMRLINDAGNLQSDILRATSLDFQIDRHPNRSGYEPSSLRIGIGGEMSISTGQYAHDPQVTLVRVGTRSIYAFYETGLLLGSAQE